MIILDEKQYARRCLEENSLGENTYITLSIIAKYYYFDCGYKKKKIKELLKEFLTTNYIAFPKEENAWNNNIEKIVNKVNKQKLYEISGVKITKAEIDRIQTLQNKLLEKLAFTMLCLAKFHNAKNENNNGWVTTLGKELLNLANINCPQSRLNIHINNLYEAGLLDLPLRCDNTNCRINFIDNDGDEELFVSDFRNLGFEYLLYCGENYIRCAECGALTKGNKNGTKKYCSKCNSYSKLGFKIRYCIDCGTPFKVAPNVATKIRCDTCQHKHNNLNKKKWRDSKNDKSICI